MGASIYLFVEYDVSNCKLHHLSPSHGPFSKYAAKVHHIRAVADGPFDIPATSSLYTLFGCRPERKISPKYFPEFASTTASNYFFWYVLDKEEKELPRYSRPTVTRSEAEEMVNRGTSIYRDHSQKKMGEVSNPEYHSHGYRTLEEIKSSLGELDIAIESTPFQFQAVLELMASYEQACGKNFVRVVYAFLD